MKEITTLGIDLAKRKFRLVGMTATGKVALQKWLYRDELPTFMANLRPCLVGMEACAGAHYWAREFKRHGHEVKLMPPQYVKAYVKTNKNDTTDAEGCAEAVTRPTMRFVAAKTEDQQVLTQLHRARERLVGARTSLGNQIRGFLGEFGLVVPQGIKRLMQLVTESVDRNRERLHDITLETISRLCDEFRRLDEEVEFYDQKLKKIHKANPQCQRLKSIPGIAEITATAMIAKFSSVEQFKNGRHFAAFLGLVPRQHSTGGKSRLGAISKHGDVYLRRLLVQGANAVLQNVKKKKDPYSLWALELCERRGWRRAAVALANKNARIAWAILARGAVFDPHFVRERMAP